MDYRDLWPLFGGIESTGMMSAQAIANDGEQFVKFARKLTLVQHMIEFAKDEGTASSIMSRALEVLDRPYDDSYCHTGDTGLAIYLIILADSNQREWAKDLATAYFGSGVKLWWSYLVAKNYLSGRWS